MLAAMRGAVRPHEARAIGDEADAAKLEASPLPLDTPGKVRLWIDALTDADLDAQLRVLHLIAGSGEWQQLDTALRIAVVAAIKGRPAISMATAILGRFDGSNDWSGAIRRARRWTRPSPDVVSLGDPYWPILWTRPRWSRAGSRSGARWDLFTVRRRLGKTTILAAAAARVSRGQPWAGQNTAAGTVLVVTVTTTRARGRWPCATLGRTPDAHPDGAGARGVQARASSRRSWLSITPVRGSSSTICGHGAGSMDRDVDSSF